MSNQLSIDFTPKNWRNTDPGTSRAAGVSVRIRAGSQRHSVLLAFALGGDLTAEDAGRLSGLDQKPGCCYWKRVSELLAGGFLEETGEQRKSRAGENQRVLRIFACGKDEIARITALGDKQV